MYVNNERELSLTHYLAQRDLLQQISKLPLTEIRKFVEDTLKEVENKLKKAFLE